MMDQTAGIGQAEPEILNLEDAMEHYQQSLLRYAARVLNNDEAAQDVVQEAFIRLHGNLEKITKRGVQLKGWLFRTTHNAAVDYIRKESRRRNLHERQSKQADLYLPDSGGQQEHDEKQALVMQHLNTLKPKEREVLVLRLQGGSLELVELLLEVGIVKARLPPGGVIEVKFIICGMVSDTIFLLALRDFFRLFL